MKQLLILFSVLVLSGCVKVVSDQVRPLIDPTVTFSAVKSTPDNYLGKHLLVGGKITAATITDGLSSLEIEQLPVDQEGIPHDIDQTGGHFIAESASHYDSINYRPGSIVTVVGEVTGKRHVTRDGVTMLYPVLTIKEIYLWDASKFGEKKRPTPENPYASTYDRPLPERPLTPLPHIR
jgi:outer membrane lipoprotein